MKRELATAVADLPHLYVPVVVVLAHNETGIRCVTCRRKQGHPLHDDRELALDQAPHEPMLVTEKALGWGKD